MHDPAKFPLAEYRQDPSGAPGYAGKRGGEIANYTPVDGPIGDGLARRLIHGYYASATYADAQIGKVLDELDRLGLDDNTVIALWGDHGWHLGDHNYWTKHTNYEQANRIPIIIVAPGVAEPGSVSGQLTESVDLYPTLSELAGLPAPSGPQPIDGLSLVPVLKDTSQRIRNHAYHCFPKGGKMGRAIRTNRYRLVEWKVPGQGADTAEYELYDYREDPLEKVNLASSEPQALKRLKKILDTHPEAKMLPRKKK
ncbi:MAG: sulfatase-like hydrolase/transferase [Planctomycetota bacterium]